MRIIVRILFASIFALAALLTEGYCFLIIERLSAIMDMRRSC